MIFDFQQKQRRSAIEQVLSRLENYYASISDFPTSPELNIQNIRTFVEQFDLDKGHDFRDAISHVSNGLEEYAVHTPHPKYFGLFNPRSNFAGILADLITAIYNPQLAAWSHAPFAVEVEAFVLRAFAVKYGYDSEISDGVFTAGGAEANLTAMLCALNHQYPQFASKGLFGIDKRPIIFCSEEAHHSIHKAAKVVGLGYDSVRAIPTKDNLKMDLDILEYEIEQLDDSLQPLMIVGTAGTTGTGTVDNLTEISAICKRKKIWFHVDAAYGGAVIISRQLKGILGGVELSDSITFDAHKWMSLPMATSIFLTKHNDILHKTFRISADYMPKEAEQMKIVDPFAHSIQWSRRFIGLKVYLSLLIYGWQGYEKAIDHQKEMGDILKNRLLESGWAIKNYSDLPVICFSDPRYEDGSEFCSAIVKNVLSRGKSWMSVYTIKNTLTLRACITNYTTSEKEIDALVSELNQARLLFTNSFAKD